MAEPITLILGGTALWAFLRGKKSKESPIDQTTRDALRAEWDRVAKQADALFATVLASAVAQVEAALAAKCVVTIGTTCYDQLLLGAAASATHQAWRQLSDLDKYKIMTGGN